MITTKSQLIQIYLALFKPEINSSYVCLWCNVSHLQYPKSICIFLVRTSDKQQVLKDISDE